jgi:hypothetical protein
MCHCKSYSCRCTARSRWKSRTGNNRWCFHSIYHCWWTCMFSSRRHSTINSITVFPLFLPIKYVNHRRRQAACKTASNIGLVRWFDYVRLFIYFRLSSVIEAKTMVCLEVMQVFIMCPIFYTLIDNQCLSVRVTIHVRFILECFVDVCAVVQQALERSPAYESIRHVLKSFNVEQVRWICHRNMSRYVHVSFSSYILEIGRWTERLAKSVTQ